MIGLFLWGAVALWNWGYDKFGPKTYKAFFYYDVTDLSKSWTQEVGSLGECRDWVETAFVADFDGEYDYECGINCRYDPDYSSEICEETIR